MTSGRRIPGAGVLAALRGDRADGTRRRAVPRAVRPLALLRRYGPLELAGTAGALAAAWGAHAVTGSLAAAAVAGTAGENAGFYGLAAVAAIRRHAERGWRSPRVALRVGWRAARDLAVEFGPAELVDSFWARPGLMYALGAWLGVGPGVVAGKLAADVVFYAVAAGCRALHPRRTSAAPEGASR